MTETFQCGDGEALVAYLYDECAAEEREAIAAHAAHCARCAAELDGLGGTRRQLAAWAPPEARLGFRVSASDADTVVDARAAFGARGDASAGAGRAGTLAWWRRPLPAWAQAAAAILIFAAGVGVGTGRSSTATAPRSADAQTTALEADVKALHDRVAGVERMSRAGQAPDAAEIDRRIEAAFREQVPAERQWVRTQIAASEDRWRQTLAIRTLEVVADLNEGQRRSDHEQVRRFEQSQRELFRGMRSMPVSLVNGQ